MPELVFKGKSRLGPMVPNFKNSSKKSMTDGVKFQKKSVELTNVQNDSELITKTERQARHEMHTTVT